MPKICISVALCTFNGARFLQEQLESIATQSRLPDELVVCDDQSTDKTVEIIRAFSLRAPFPVRLEVNERNLGSTKNFEKAIGLCGGGIIALADQDDVWKPQKLSKLWQVLHENPEAGYAFSDAEIIDQHGSRLEKNLWDSIGFHGSLQNGFLPAGQVAVLLKRARATGATMGFRSSLKSLVLPISRYLVQDYWISLLASCVGKYGVPVQEALIQYRQHADQQIGTGSRPLIEKVRRARRARASGYDSATQGFQDLRERLLVVARDGGTCSPNHLALLNGKIKHCSRREAAHSERGATKIRQVVAEVFSGRYARFSNSWVRIVEDLCL